MSQRVYVERPEDFAPRVEVAACWCEWEAKALFLRTSPGKDFAGLWGLPAGKVEKGETPLEAAVRETYEESGLSLEASQLDPLGLVYVRDPFDFVFYLFCVELPMQPKGVVLRPNEHDSACWVGRNELHDLSLIPAAREAFEFFFGGSL